MPRTKSDQNYWIFLLKNELKKHRQADIAKVLGCSQQTVSYKMKHIAFTLPELAKLKRELGINMERVVKNF